MLKDTQQGHISTNLAAVATSCVYMKSHSGKPTLMANKLLLDPYTASNMNSSIQLQATFTTTYSLKETTAVDHYRKTPLRVQCATWEVVQQSSWFQQEHSVRTAGPWSMLDMSLQRSRKYQSTENAAATFAGTRHRKSQLAEHHKTKLPSTLLKSAADHCHVKTTSVEESSPALSAPNN